MISDVSIGIISLDPPIERIRQEAGTPGNLKCDATFDFQLKMETVRGTYPGGSEWAGGEMVSEFVNAAKKLEARGVSAIAADCGFIAVYQKEIAKSVSVPVVTSSLIQVPLVYQMLAENKRVGILTDCSEVKVGEQQFNAVGWSSKDIPIAIKSFTAKWDLIPTKDLVRKAKELMEEYTDIGAFVLECSVLPPHARAIQRATGMPVFDITTAIKLVYSAVDPPDYHRE